MHYLPELATLGLVLLLGCISPGPDFVAVTSHALAARRSGVKVACGIAAAITIWATLSVLGLAFLLSRVTVVYEAVRLAGAAFLVYLGVRLLLSARQPDRHAPPRVQAATRPGSFRRGFLLGLFNPKSAVFFSSLFATLLPATAPVWVFVATIALAAATAFGWFITVAWLFSVGRVQAVYRQARRMIDATMGVVLAGLGLRLAFEG